LQPITLASEDAQRKITLDDITTAIEWGRVRDHGDVKVIFFGRKEARAFRQAQASSNAEDVCVVLKGAVVLTAYRVFGRGRRHITRASK